MLVIEFELLLADRDEVSDRIEGLLILGFLQRLQIIAMMNRNHFIDDTQMRTFFLDRVSIGDMDSG